MGERASSRGSARRGGAEGFTLIECMLGLMMMALLAGLALPGLQRVAGPAALRISAYEIAALLRNERTSAAALGHATATMIDSGADRVSGSASGAYVTLPNGASVSVTENGADAIRFFADGRSSGGGLLLRGQASSLLIAVSPDTGAVRLAAP